MPLKKRSSKKRAALQNGGFGEEDLGLSRLTPEMEGFPTMFKLSVAKQGNDWGRVYVKY